MADEATWYKRLAREAGMSNFVKLEVIGDQKTLFLTTKRFCRLRDAGQGNCRPPYTNDTRSSARSSKTAALPR
jgi:thiazole synthase